MNKKQTFALEHARSLMAAILFAQLPGHKELRACLGSWNEENYVIAPARAGIDV